MATLIQELSFSPRGGSPSPPDDDCATYYIQRGMKARAMAAAAIDPAIRKIHLAMAQGYDNKVEQSTASVFRVRPSIRA